MDQEAVQNSENGAQLLEKGNKWLQRISSAETREDDWRKDAEAAEKTYACDPKAKNGKLYDFNILHSNVETIVPAIYNSTPVPDVRPRFVTAIGPAPQPPAPPQQPQGPGAPDQQQQPPIGTGSPSEILSERMRALVKRPMAFAGSGLPAAAIRRRRLGHPT